MVLRTSLEAKNRHLKNNTPVHTEVLWGCGLWGRVLRTSAPGTDQIQQVLDLDGAVALGVTHA